MKILKTNLSKSNRNNKGVVLVFALMIIFIVLTISLGLVSMTVSELNFVTYSANSNKAFYAANTGAECALFYDFQEKYGEEISCAGLTVPGLLGNFDPTTNTGDSSPFTLNLEGNTCAKVYIEKTYKENDDGSYTLETKIISKGYNRDCDSTESSKVIEREIEVNY